jgi:hypothetical protein
MSQITGQVEVEVNAAVKLRRRAAGSSSRSRMLWTATALMPSTMTSCSPNCRAAAAIPFS